MNYKEEDLYEVLAFYLKNDSYFKSYTKITDGRTFGYKTQENGNGKWVMPDCISVYFPNEDFKNTLSLQQELNEYQIKFYSFEVKRELVTATYKEAYAQAVFNSSWANSGYLVCDKRYFDPNLKEDIDRLSQLHGIGLILLNIESPTFSEILVKAKVNKQINYINLEKMCNISPKFKEILDGIIGTIKISKNNIPFELIKNFEDIPLDDSFYTEEKYLKKFGLEVKNCETSIDEKGKIKLNEIINANNLLFRLNDKDKIITDKNNNIIISETSYKFLFVNFLRFLLSNEDFKNITNNLSDIKDDFYTTYYAKAKQPILTNKIPDGQISRYTKLFNELYTYSNYSADSIIERINYIIEYVSKLYKKESENQNN